MVNLTFWCRLTSMAWWCNGYDRLVTHRSRVCLPAIQLSLSTLGKLFTYMYLLLPSANNTNWY